MVVVTIYWKSGWLPTCSRSFIKECGRDVAGVGKLCKLFSSDPSLFASPITSNWRQPFWAEGNIVDCVDLQDLLSEYPPINER